MDYIRSMYGVPAARNARVRYTGGRTPREGTITGTMGAYLLIRLDGEQHAKPYHPTWEIEYLAPTPKEPTR